MKLIARPLTVKRSYTVPCSSQFRTSVEALAERKKVNVGDLARSILLALPKEVIEAHEDPGDPPKGDRETVILKSGPSSGKPWRRKPRLQVRLPEGETPVRIRKALSLALTMDEGEMVVRVDRADDLHKEKESAQAVAVADQAQSEEIERLRAIVGVLSFEPLSAGVTSRAEALHVLGFPPNALPDDKTVRARFRMLATIHHPDSHYGNHQRMSQLNAAMDVMRTGGRSLY